MIVLGDLYARKASNAKIEKLLAQQVKDKLEVVLKETNLFFEKDWENYKMEMNQLNLSPFKKTQRPLSCFKSIRFGQNCLQRNSVHGEPNEPDVALSGVVDTCSISSGDGWTEGTGNGVRGSNHRGEFFYTTS